MYSPEHQVWDLGLSHDLRDFFFDLMTLRNPISLTFSGGKCKGEKKSPGKTQGSAVLTRREGRGNLSYLHIFQTVFLTYASQYILLTALLQFSGEQQLIQDEICLLEVEDDVKFADVAIVLIHLFHITVYNLEGDELIISGCAACDEEEGCVSSVDYFAI